MTKPSEEIMTKEERVFLMKAIWTALSKPKWTKDDLIDFGKALFARQSLHEMSEKLFARIYPFLLEITDALGKQMSDKAQEIASSMGLTEKEEEQKEEPPKAAKEEPKEKTATKASEKKDSLK
jgi:hypothetical protein